MSEKTDASIRAYRKKVYDMKARLGVEILENDDVKMREFLTIYHINRLDDKGKMTRFIHDKFGYWPRSICWDSDLEEDAIVLGIQNYLNTPQNTECVADFDDLDVDEDAREITIGVDIDEIDGYSASVFVKEVYSFDEIKDLTVKEFAEKVAQSVAQSAQNEREERETRSPPEPDYEPDRYYE